MASGPVSRATYWRRRVFLLVGVLAVLTLIAYACRPSSDEGDPVSSASTDSSAEPQTTPDSGEGTDPSIPASPSAEADDADDSDGGDEADGANGSAGGGSGGGQGVAPAGGAGANAVPQGGGGGSPPAAAPCHPEDVVVSVESDREDYAAGVEPVFTLSLVNIGPSVCTAEVGTKTVELRITSGEDRIWSSTDCVEATAEPVELRRGVPHDVEITWNRTRSWKDCRESVVHARPGTYVAKPYSDYETEGKQVFRLH